METAVIILAAGQGSRMQSDLPKVLHRLGDAPLLAHAQRLALSIDAARRVVVTGHGGDAVAAAAHDADADVELVEQAEQKGTAHAVDQARDLLGGFDGDLLVLYGDTPLITEATVAAMQSRRADGDAVVVLGFEADDPGGYGRLIRGADGGLDAIIEAKDATPDQRAVRLFNSGVLLAPAKLLFDLISEVGNENASGEYYLTDIVALARARDLPCGIVTCPEAETLGVNSRADLARAEAAFQARARAEALENGVTMTDPDTVYFALDTVIGRDVVLEPNIQFLSGVTVESGATIRAFSHLEGAHVSDGAVIGPFARLRPGAEIGGGAKVGNFVEVKNAEVAQGAKLNHLSYVGDASVGEEANLGAGTITCNYDGVSKHRTEIGDRAFVGSNSSLVAPVRVGAGALVASGSVITTDVPDEALSLARARQVNKPGLATRLFQKLRADKARRDAGET
ncbi:bifunctional UDP-N-acetylglucosamine diphosphorylase/glucosamine-1-phosphate N-acetyltransferase GlmU [Oceanomicrobium pacificus]|uniref:Bifunctional protein GlmU n=1 Tax=Oceanomicrobium pacificus TaxID=2692916 RepID=A0A6B0TPK2_9RHOB|nr:bifunctional UDP-N-acetylglucosamine diphosphorylase/glucosamine-1-phosphate N-acetyltransferase GlmU [Oceanomicrobium pacificus]MXU66527.1 bifunctional UDP-N-acetylglucosamine diphosphorylase/glucosamine-1-phosphate N-acetyltransferase GlmU [Oceanomicrobium pacificus]